MLAYSCTYPFTPEIPDLEERLVIEGDILIGTKTRISVSYMMALDAPKDSEVQPSATVYVEDSKGNTYPAVRTVEYVGVHNNEKIVYIADTKDAPEDLEYRLVVKNNENGRHYSTPFQPVQQAPVIDSLSYMINAPRTELDITISLTSPENQKYYRWTFTEEWEYNSVYYADVYAVPGKTTEDPVEIVNFPVEGIGDNYYHCWNNSVSDGILLGTVEGLTSNKLVNHKFAKIKSTETKLNYIYRMTVTLQSISQAGYEYWSNLDVISNNPGQLDAPNPSEMVGNIVCDDDPKEYVIGFINVSGTSVARRYLFNEDLSFYDRTEDNQLAGLEEVMPDQYNQFYYDSYYRPVYWGYSMAGRVLMWGHARCVDCRLKGGSKEKRPDDWINNDR